MKKILLVFCLLHTVSFVFSQSDQNTIENQFAEVIEKSNNYKQYKVVKKVKLYSLRKNVLDSISKLEKRILENRNKIQTQAASINTLESELQATKDDLRDSIERENGIELFGSTIKKSTYNTLLFSIIWLLIVALILLFFRFKNTRSVTKITREKLAEVEEEYESYRRRSLEREQELRRKLQDEINKNKNI